jgi:hypothetical protein
MENRVVRFYELHNNKWFHIMNLSLEIIKTYDKKERWMLMKYGHYLFYTNEHLKPAPPDKN